MTAGTLWLQYTWRHDSSVLWLRISNVSSVDTSIGYCIQMSVHPFSTAQLMYITDRHVILNHQQSLFHIARPVYKVQQLRAYFLPVCFQEQQSRKMGIRKGWSFKLCMNLWRWWHSLQFQALSSGLVSRVTSYQLLLPQILLLPFSHFSAL